MLDSRLLSACLICTLLLGGCSGMRARHSEATPPVLGAARVPLGDTAAIRQSLLEQYQQWKGVPYRYGGANREGLDCSAFVQITYRYRFGVELPRDTSAQRQAGVDVARDRIAPGDLLFFRTSELASHVGIYIGGESFLHVSTRAGVMLSSLREPYWAARFRRATRISGD